MRVIIIVFAALFMITCSTPTDKIDDIPKEILEEDYLLEFALDIQLLNDEGLVVKLSDLKGKLVVLDFWASWCEPCRKLSPKLRGLYHKYKDKNFEVFSVSLDGLETQKNSRKDWLEAIEEDDLNWKYHVSELKGWDSRAVEDYGLESIPSFFLIGEKGNILLKNTTLDQIESYLQTYYSTE